MRTPGLLTRLPYLTNAAELERLGMIAPPKEFEPLPANPARVVHRGGHIWPSYDVAVSYAPMNRAGTDKDYSAADIGWCMTSIRWKFGVEETAAMLLKVSEHARLPSNRERYAERTAGKAAEYVMQRSRLRLSTTHDAG